MNRTDGLYDAPNHKRPQILPADAGANPDAMMVKTWHASIAHIAVRHVENPLAVASPAMNFLIAV